MGAQVDFWVARLLTPLACWILISGIDDCVADAAAALAWLTELVPALSRPIRWLFRLPARPAGEPIGRPDEAAMATTHYRRVAIFVAAWREHRVIRKMLENNIARLRYPAYDIFVGAYENDSLTQAAVRDVMRRHHNVHLAVCPHDGPTSKADCLNWIYQRMLLYEEAHRCSYEIVVVHDSEDVIDPAGLRWINYYMQWNDMVQVPVLALATPAFEVTHGAYCDEFSESQHKSMMARGLLGGFIPSTGVGTGLSRRALEALAEANNNRIFEPGCLTEDYELGYRVAGLGLKQKFVPIRMQDGRPMATREFFPKEFRAAVRQRTRWITGNCLQAWERHGWGGSFRSAYWFWRDRKTLIGNLVGPLSNLFFLYGAVTLSWALSTHNQWELGRAAPWLAKASAAGLSFQVLHAVTRIFCTARVYGWRFAAGVPLRLVAANWINVFATCGAFWTWARAKALGRPLRWVKTEHAYPNRAALMEESQSLEEILARGWIAREALEAALASKPPARRLEEHLLKLGLMTEEELYEVLALHHRVPLGKPVRETVSIRATRTLPAKMAREWRVMPFRISDGLIHVAGPEPPDEGIEANVHRFTSLEIKFHLVTPTEFEELAAEYLGVEESDYSLPSEATSRQ